MVISVRTYEQIALEDGDAVWELAGGVLRQKPGMTYEHNEAMTALAWQFMAQFDQREFTVRVNASRLHIESTGSYYVPDLFVIPRRLAERVRDARPQRLEVYDEPLPLVVEVWSRSTGD